MPYHIETAFFEYENTRRFIGPYKGKIRIGGVP